MYLRDNEAVGNDIDYKIMHYYILLSKLIFINNFEKKHFFVNTQTYSSLCCNNRSNLLRIYFQISIATKNISVDISNRFEFRISKAWLQTY